jgi:EAL domain-containing protein (putative c-di-GMP-specific phosphodiesterase class I)
MNTRPKPAERPPSHESLLLDHAQRLTRHRAGRRAVHVHLSKLRMENKRAQHLRIAANAFQNLFRSYDGQLFSLRNADMIFVTKLASREEIDSLIAKFRPIFGDDPAVLSEDPARPFYTVYDLESHYDEFLALVERLLQQQQRAEAGPTIYTPDLLPLRPEELAHVDRALAQADITGLVRRQPISVLLPGAPPHAVFSELYVSIADLRNLIAPKVDLASSRWLFQHLTETLDRRMLAAIATLPEWKSAGRFSINLNISTLLSDPFIAFMESVGRADHRTLVIEVQMLDLAADTSDFMLARDFLRARGHKVCLDGVTPLNAGLLDVGRLGVDMVKVVWSPEMADPAMTQRRSEIAGLVRRMGEARVILCRCGDAAAVEAGQALGVNLFQGRHIDRLLEISRKPGGAQAVFDPAA